MTMLCDGMLLGAGGGGPNITFVAGTTAAVTSAANFVINKPAGVQVGDLMLMGFFATAMTSNTTPTGWTLVSSDYTAGSGNRHVIYSRVVDGSEGSSFTVAGNSVSKAGFVVAFRGAATVGTVGAVARASSTTTGTASSISPGVAGALIAVFSNDDNRTVGTPPAGMTQATVISGAPGGSNTVYYLIPSGVGATGSKTLIWSSSGGLASLLLQIN